MNTFYIYVSLIAIFDLMVSMLAKMGGSIGESKISVKNEFKIKKK